MSEANRKVAPHGCPAQNHAEILAEGHCFLSLRANPENPKTLNPKALKP